MSIRVWLPICSLAFLLPSGCAGRLRNNTNPQPRAEPVAYCELISHADKYDGRRVLTEATWLPGFHAESLMDTACREVNGRPGLTLSLDHPATAPRAGRCTRFWKKAGQPWSMSPESSTSEKGEAMSAERGSHTALMWNAF